MLKIRLQRVGRKHDPSFRIVLTDSKNGPKSGKFLEILGNYDPKKDIRKVDGDRVKELMATGAQVSDTVYNILVSEKVFDGKKINVLPKKSPIIKEQTEEEKKEEGDKKDEVTEETPEETKTEAEAPVEETKEEKTEVEIKDVKKEAKIETKAKEVEAEILEEESEDKTEEGESIEETKKETPSEESK